LGSLPCLASDGFIYILGAFEIVSALALILGIGVRYVRLVVLFTGTLTAVWTDNRGSAIRQRMRKPSPGAS
jgi:uncharacterized membrane protein YphA (DoxX/SURF4 family)